MGIYNNNFNDITYSVMDNCNNSVQFMLKTVGTMALWGGLMNIVKE